MYTVGYKVRVFTLYSGLQSSQIKRVIFQRKIVDTFLTGGLLLGSRRSKPFQVLWQVFRVTFSVALNMICTLLLGTQRVFHFYFWGKMSLFSSVWDFTITPSHCLFMFKCTFIALVVLLLVKIFCSCDMDINTTTFQWFLLSVTIDVYFLRGCVKRVIEHILDIWQDTRKVFIVLVGTLSALRKACDDTAC